MGELVFFTYMISLPEWRCRIGRITLKPGVSMHVPYTCGDFFA